MKINVYNKEGELCKFDVDDNITVEKLKFMALGHFGANIEDTIERQRATTRFKLIHTTQYRPLDDKKTLIQEELRDKDELVLNKKPPIFYEDKKDFSLGPSMAEIMVATSNLPKIYPSNFEIPKSWGSDFQTEIRRVLITLIQTSHRLLCLDPLASQMFQHFHEKLQPPVQTPAVNQEATNRLIEMGFNEQRAVKALLLNRMNPTAAADWLLEHENDPEVDAPLSSTTSTDAQRRISEPRDSFSGSLEPSTSGQKINQPSCVSVLSLNNTTPRSIIEAYRQFKKSQHAPDSQALSNLKEMGFDQSDIEEALAVCGNSEDAACEWLLQDKNRNRIKTGPKLGKGNGKDAAQEEYQGLNPDSQVSKALLTDPTILIGLNNPKMFLVLLNMYEAFVATNALHLGQWFTDPDAAIFLSQIFRIYHAEKYVDGPPSGPPTSNPHPLNPFPITLDPPLYPHDDDALDNDYSSTPRRYSSHLTGGGAGFPPLTSASYPSALNALEGVGPVRGVRNIGGGYRPYTSSRVVGGDGLYRGEGAPPSSSSSSGNSLHYSRRPPLDGDGSDRY